MPKVFGYLNQSNPLTIGDAEAQVMWNCCIERGWIEHKKYPVLDPKDRSTSYLKSLIWKQLPNREVILPNTARTQLVVYTDANNDNYGKAGSLKARYASAGSFLYKDFGIRANSCNFSATLIEPLLATSVSELKDGYYSQMESTAVVVEGQVNYQLTQPTDSTLGMAHQINYNETFIKRARIIGLSINGVLVKRELYDVVNDGSGCPNVILAFEPTSAQNGRQLRLVWRYFPGNAPLIEEPTMLSYAVTIKETATNPNRGLESPATVINTQILSPTGYGINEVKISWEIPASAVINCDQPELCIYRMPFGGSEFLLQGKYYSSNTGGIIDGVSDLELTDICTTEGDTDEYSIGSNSVMAITLIDGRLFIADSNFVYYSAPNEYNRFPAENFYAFDEDVIGFCKFESRLVIFTTTKAYVAYGVATENFYVTEIDYEVAYNISNSARSRVSKTLALTSNGNDAGSLTAKRDGILLMNRINTYDISLRVKDALQWGEAHYTTNNPFNDKVNRTNILENRYYIAELRSWTKSNGDANPHLFSIVYDMLADGFILYDDNLKDDDGTTPIYFRYRTKEFKRSAIATREAQYHKGSYVKFRGSIKVNVYGDGEKITSYTYNETSSLKPLRIFILNMGNHRSSTVSVEFIGLSADAQIHDWGIYD